MTESTTPETSTNPENKSSEYAVVFAVEEDDKSRTEFVTVEDGEVDGATAEERAVVEAAEQCPLTHVATQRVIQQGNTVFEISDPIPDEWKRVPDDDEYPNNPCANRDYLEAVYASELSETEIQIYDESVNWCVRSVVRNQQMVAIECEHRAKAEYIAMGLMWTVSEAR